jgi:glutathione S-transferase
MTNVNRIFGMELSPFSTKVRSYFRYKHIPHQWIVRDAVSTAEYAKYAKVQIVPLVVTPEGEAVQDSTPIIERFEAAHPEPSIFPPDPAARFAAILLEEFGDEWGNKWMFHLRWAREVDQISTSRRLAYGMMTAAAKPEMAEQMATQLRVWRCWMCTSRSGPTCLAGGRPSPISGYGGRSTTRGWIRLVSAGSRRVRPPCRTGSIA